MSYVTHQWPNAYVTAGLLTRLLSSLMMRESFGKAEGYDNIDAAYCLDATPLIVAGSTTNELVVGTSCNLREWTGEE
jgi:hypothetical protein